jgi:hypothetical protein
MAISTLEKQRTWFKFKKLKVSEQGRPMMQSQSKAEDLEAPWRVTFVSLHLKANEAGVWCPQVMSPAIDAFAQEEWSLHVLVGFHLLPSLFLPGSQPIG